MKNTITLISFLWVSLAATAQQVPDGAFATAIYAQCPTCITSDKSGASLLPDAATRTKLQLSGKDIKDLSGLSGFAGLEQLYCDNNNLDALPDALPEGLLVLDCSMNQLRDLPPLPNGLIELSACSNYLVSLPTLPNSLRFLHCQGNSGLALGASEEVVPLAAAASLHLYPNPTRDVLFVTLQGAAASVRQLAVIDMQGAVVLLCSIGAGSTPQTIEMAINTLPAGTYFVRAGTATAQFVKI